MSKEIRELEENSKRIIENVNYPLPKGGGLVTAQSY